MQPTRGHRSGSESTPDERGWIFDIKDRDADGLTTAEILEDLHVPGYRAYRVRWESGWESTLIPSCDHCAHPPDVTG
jgi:hypothetical protein